VENITTMGCNARKTNKKQTSTVTAGSIFVNSDDCFVPNTTTVYKNIKRFSAICLLSYWKRTHSRHVPNENNTEGN
jgi:hypothetical protein